MQSLCFRLPYPPSVNHYWRNFKGRMVISKQGSQYKRDVALISKLHNTSKLPFYKSRLSMTVYIYPPDKRRRDIDNCAKAILDALAAGNIYEDDSQIDVLTLHRKEVKKGGEVVVIISTLEQSLPE